MTEPRPRHRARGQFFATPDLIDLLYAFGDNPHPSTGPLPPTITTLSEILEDFLTETCHLASLSASYSRRQKIKVDDFKFVLREDEALLGRALEQLWKDRGLKEERRLMDVEKVGGGGAGGAAGGAGAGMEELGRWLRWVGGGGRKRKVDVAGDEGGGEAKKKVKGEQGSP
ncbi:hypothetical protein BTJ68_11250 [Hortaea werneckii EXF-2000]|uniref:Transcription initiation factor TFIID subunit 13 n=1 Tax=Hortaea werneckii EXF-2000 TaxID=1157616 RepID=A0A1Z5SYT7_HORWE|nr:hypothetical protein KC344_g359 [Hortaea werneckii]OTA26761.1 hypothetical protein BTJ68_11250 [Hortaea werneckii EXF-2000]